MRCYYAEVLKRSFGLRIFRESIDIAAVSETAAAAANSMLEQKI